MAACGRQNRANSLVHGHAQQAAACTASKRELRREARQPLQQLWRQPAASIAQLTSEYMCRQENVLQGQQHTRKRAC
jgi:hypothetical protein